MRCSMTSLQHTELELIACRLSLLILMNDLYQFHYLKALKSCDKDYVLNLCLLNLQALLLTTKEDITA
ncbi:hypothetical protein VIBNIMADA3021_510087 [Vibrio nigripulchritudo MADA3021]|nr:hypothetical protein VIBNIMADA3021_510087 [Vibrio nigripulchritudo MADA3021]